jgi:exopolyphosphatase/guanosine-5'-triphosphate,3'-diphosphate pyrophosphatase
MRSAKNAVSFIDTVRQSTGHKIRILTGEEEALWTYLGVASSPEFPKSRQQLIIDIGGGSTEIITAGKKGKPAFKSLPLGCVRLTERFIHSDPPTDSETGGIAQTINRILKEKAAGAISSADNIIGAGGTITTAAAITLAMGQYDPDKIHGCRLSLSEITEITNRLASLSLEQRKRVRGLEEKRADIIVAGLLILEAIMKFYGQDKITVSDRGILVGAIKVKAGQTY